MKLPKVQTDLEFVLSAASKDDSRPVLKALHIRGDGWMEATDGHRLHVAPAIPGGPPPGAWSARQLSLVEGTYPETNKVVPPSPPAWARRLPYPYLFDAIRLCAAAEAAQRAYGGFSVYVTLPCNSGGETVGGFNPKYVLEALHGFVHASNGSAPGPVLISQNRPLDPAFLYEASLRRLAVLMPIRRAGAHGAAPPVFDLTPCTETPGGTTVAS